jgi:hypothetical protein
MICSFEYNLGPLEVKAAKRLGPDAIHLGNAADSSCLSQFWGWYGTNSLMTRKATVPAVHVMQEWFLSEGVIPLALKLLRDEHPQCRLKGLLAASCMVRNFPPALLDFCQALQGVPVVLSLVRPAICS